MLFIHLSELEGAINYWRNRSPSSGEALKLCPEVSALAKPYAILILQGSQRLTIDQLDDKATEAWKLYQTSKKSDINQK